MATGSIYTSVKVKNKSECKKLVAALEQAKEKSAKSKKTIPSRSIEIVKGERVRELFQ